METLNTFRKLLIVSGLLLLPSVLIFAQEINVPVETKASTFEQWKIEVSNWGRWGKEDQLGTLNLITAELKIQAASLVKEGKSISLAMNLSKEEGINNGNPIIHKLSTSGQWAVDTYTINYHGYAHSHIDALCHIALEGELYNGYSADSRKSTGAGKLGIQHMSEGIFSRGILVDIPWLKGVPYLEPGTAILAKDLEAWELKTGIQISSGDVLLIRTGRMECEKQNGSWNYSQKASGLHVSTVRWLKEKDIAVLGSDGASDVLPSHVEGQSHPVHMLVLLAMGTPILDNLNLEELTEQARLSNRWEFLFVGTPLRIEGGTGSPLNPIAVY
jgi:kynurenine formamidase